MRVLIIVPAFNEEDNIVKTINSIKNVGEVDILVINDQSQDNTLLFAKMQKGIMVVDLPCNLGIGGAVQTGYIFAKEKKYDVAIQIDGDGQHDPKFIWDMIHLIYNDNWDIIIGSRFIDKIGFQSTKLRRVGIIYIQFLLRLILGVQITDPTSGFRAFGKRAIDYFSKYYPIDYPEPESIVIAHRLGMKIKEIPVIMKNREGGNSSIYTYKSVYYMIKVTLSILIAKVGRIAKEI